MHLAKGSSGRLSLSHPTVEMLWLIFALWIAAVLVVMICRPLGQGSNAGRDRSNRCLALLHL